MRRRRRQFLEHRSSFVMYRKTDILDCRREKNWLQELIQPAHLGARARRTRRLEREQQLATCIQHAVAQRVWLSPVHAADAFRISRDGTQLTRPAIVCGRGPTHPSRRPAGELRRVQSTRTKIHHRLIAMRHARTQVRRRRADSGRCWTAYSFSKRS